MKRKLILSWIGIILYAAFIPIYIRGSSVIHHDSSFIVFGLHAIITIVFAVFPFVNKRHISINRIILSYLAMMSIDFGVAGIIEKQLTLKLAQHGSIDYFDVVYQTLSLFSFASDAAKENVPLVLNIARYTAVTTTIALLLTIFASKLTNWLRVKFYANHVIICGLSEAGSRMAKSFLEKGIPVVAIELDSQNNETENIKALGGIVFQGNAYDELILKDAGIERSKYVIAVTGNDELNIDIVSKVSRLRKVNKTSLVCYAHVQESAKKRLYRQHEIFNDITDKFDARIFNLFDMSARQIVHQYPPDSDAENQGVNIRDHSVRIMVAGDGALANALVRQTALTGHYESLQKPLVYLDQAVKNPINAESITLKQIIDIETIAIEKSCDGNLAISRLIICFDNEVEGYKYLTRILQLGVDKSIPVLFCAPHSAGLTALFRGSAFFRDFPRVTFFDVVENVFQHHVLIDDENDDLAKRIHAYYRSIYPSNPNDRTWEQLTEDIRDSNRLAADHMKIKERAADRLRNGTPSCSEGEIFNILAQMEHNRWFAEKVLAGYVKEIHSGPRNAIEQEVRKLHPLLLRWTELDSENQQANVERIKHLYQTLHPNHIA